jgi:microtubule-associated protein-like 6
VKTLEAAANARTVSSQKPFAAGVAAFGPVAPLGGKPHSSVVSTANRGGGSFEFVTFGSKHVKLWRRDGAGAWNGRALRFGEAAPFSTRAAVFLPGGNLLVGNDDGTLAVFDLEKRCVKRIVRGFAHQTARTAPSESRGAGPNAKRPSGDRARGVGALVLLEDEKTVVSAGADGRIVAWRLTASLDDVEDTPYEEIQLQNPRGPNAPPPRIRSLAVVVDAPPPPPLVATTSSGGTVSGAVSGAVSGSPRRPRAADPPWGVDGDVEPPPQGRFPTKPREAIPWALALEDEGRAAFQESRAEGVSLSGARSSGASARRMSDLFSRVSCFAGTTACDLWEVSAIRARVRIAGASGTVDCVAWNPDFPVCATLGSDGSVRLFDARRRAHVGAKDVGRGSPGRSLSFSGDGKLLAAGFADGRIAVLRARTLESVAETAPVARDRRGKTPGWSETTLAGNNRVETVAFSPDSVYLAAGGGDGVVRLYANISGSFGLLETFAGHSCTVRALDWSKDGCVLRSQCVGGELLHWKPSSRTREGFSSVAAVNRRGEGHRGLPYSGDARDIQWHTHSSTVGFPVMGVWEAGKASSRIVDALDRSPDERFIVVGDDAGDIRVLNYPCVVRSAPGRKLAAHGARVGAVAFSLDGEWVASAGTADQTLIVWRTQAEERGR